MATPDFSKVWASNSPLTAYTWSDADYLSGWYSVGSTPPSKQQFDAWMNASDLKMQYLYSVSGNSLLTISATASKPASMATGGLWIEELS